MTYPIATLVWGIPQTKEILDLVIPDNPGFGLDSEVGNCVRDVDDLLYGEPGHNPPGFGFAGLYSASPDNDDNCGYLGVELWSGPYWELTHDVFAQERHAELAEAEKRFEASLEALPEWFRSALPKPSLQVVWSDS